MEATVGSRTSSRGAGLDLRKVKEVSFDNFKVIVVAIVAIVIIVPIPIVIIPILTHRHLTHPHPHRHLHHRHVHVHHQQEPAVIREWREKQVTKSFPMTTNKFRTTKNIIKCYLL